MKLKCVGLNLLGLCMYALAAFVAMCVYPKGIAFFISLITLIAGLVCFEYADKPIKSQAGAQ